MRLTIKYLQEKLQRMEEDKNRYYEKWKELQEEADKRKYEFDIRNSERVDALQGENRKLMQIIRILAKDETLVKEMEIQAERTTRNFN